MHVIGLQGVEAGKAAREGLGDLPNWRENVNERRSGDTNNYDNQVRGLITLK
jgi:hypothetical protein